MDIETGREIGAMGAAGSLGGWGHRVNAPGPKREIEANGATGLNERKGYRVLFMTT